MPRPRTVVAVLLLLFFAWFFFGCTPPPQPPPAPIQESKSGIETPGASQGEESSLVRSLYEGHPRREVERPQGPGPEIRVWRTLKLGTSTEEALRAALEQSRYIGDWADNMLEKMSLDVAAKETEVDLVVLSLTQLGFRGEPTFEEAYARAKSLGLSLCPNEVGPRLRLEYLNQPEDEWLNIAMEPVIIRGNQQFVFFLDGGPYLGGMGGHKGDGMANDHKFVFVQPRKPAGI